MPVPMPLAPPVTIATFFARSNDEIKFAGPDASCHSHNLPRPV
jgi:hypothetical protein